MSQFSHTRFRLLLAAAPFILALAGCATTAPEAAEPVAEVEPVCEYEPWDGDGMEIPLDGSSQEAWDCSMERVQAHTSETEYASLDAAISYLLTYDLTARHKMENLIKGLDGLTGYEIVDRVRWRKPAPGKGPAEKGAADAKLIDT